MVVVDVKKLYEQYGFLIHGRCVRILGSEDDAHDAVQSVFSALIQNLSSIRQPERIVPWIYRAAQNHCFNVLRERRKRRDICDADTVAGAETADGRLGDRQIIALALACHGRNVREDVYYTYVEQLTQDEIRRITGRSPATIRRHVRRFERGLPALRKRLGI